MNGVSVLNSWLLVRIRSGRRTEPSFRAKGASSAPPLNSRAIFRRQPASEADKFSLRHEGASRRETTRERVFAFRRLLARISILTYHGI